MAGSFFANAAVRFFYTLNLWYENSLIHKSAERLAAYSKKSLAAKILRRLFAESRTDWVEGSYVFAAARRIGSFVWRGISTAKNSLSIKIFALEGFAPSLLKPELAMCAFVLLLSVLPADYWNNMYSLYAAVLLAVCYAANLILYPERKAAHKKIPASLAVYFGIIVFNLFLGTEFSDSLRVTAIFFSCAATGILAQNILNTEKRLDLFLTAAFAGVFITSVYGLYQYAAGIEVRADLVDLLASPGLRRVFSTMANPNNYAEYLILFLPFCVSFALKRESARGKFLAVSMLAPMFIALALTSSRSAYLAAAGAAALYVFFANKRLIPLLALALILAAPFMPASIVGRLMTIGSDSSSKYRLMIWEASVAALKDFWVFGVGMGPAAFNKIYRIYSNQNAVNAMHAHNLFLQVWIENGIFGFVAFAAFYAGLIKKLISGLAARSGIKTDGYRIAALCSLVGFAAFGTVEYTWFYPRVTLSFWIVAGVALGIAGRAGE